MYWYSNSSLDVVLHDKYYVVPIFTMCYRIGRTDQSGFAKSSVTRFGEISPLGHIFKSMCNSMRVYLIFGQI